MDIDRDNPDDFFMRVVFSDEFSKELLSGISKDENKEHPEMIIKDFDPKTGVLIFAGKDIALSKTGKETDQVLLMKSLMDTK